ncbi:hypothetical protein D7X74_21315 [Corallococcus sp. CA047B]|uniref:hypothetical protein n=1 Tax=Corallococcus sp. CA047B TaxID=2316729 RepID=UPI000EA02A99|nr:hypothetical protein [Corallococcus sp. CA047B]RKH13789.1 hypothetical protein D7X74_21315 [Corallococcus sp. CA047B]
MNTSEREASKGHNTGGVGPYRFGKRLRVGEGLGRLYEARNEVTGAPGFVLLPTGARPDLEPQVELALRVSTSVSPPYIALEMESGPATPSEDAEAEVADLTDDLADMVTSALRSPRRLTHLFSGRKELGPRTGSPAPVPAPVVARPRRALRIVVACAAAIAAVFLTVPGGPTEPPREPPAEPAVVYVPATIDDGVLTNTLAGGSSSQPLKVERRIVVPDRPLDGQKVPPCARPEREVNGGCWLKLDEKIPCPPKTAEHKGGCYVAVPAPPGNALWELPPRDMAPARPAGRGGE